VDLERRAELAPAGRTAARSPADARDLREGGRWTWGQRVKNDALYALATAALFAARQAPLGALAALGAGVGALAHVAWGSGRRVALANVARALPEASERERRALVRESFRRLGSYLADAVAQLDGRALLPRLTVDDESLATMAEARAGGRGVLFASGHLGPWERVAAALVAHRIPLVTIAREPYDPRFASVYEALRERHGVGVIYRGHAGAPTRIVRTLRRGGVLGVPMDLATRAPSVLVPFLGHPAPTPIGPARLALRAGARVVVGTFAPPWRVAITAIDTADLDASADAELELLARINGELSRRVLASPEGFLWMHPRWGTEAATVTSLAPKSAVLSST